MHGVVAYYANNVERLLNLYRESFLDQGCNVVINIDARLTEFFA